MQRIRKKKMKNIYKGGARKRAKNKIESYKNVADSSFASSSHAAATTTIVTCA
jgi:hypothetical protein